VASAGGDWRQVRVRWLEGSRAEETPFKLFLEGGWQKVELLGEELHEGPEPGSPRRRRFKLMISGAVYLLEGPFDGGEWKLRGPLPS
jgi:hypothetical protein